VVVEFTHSNAIQGLIDIGAISWCYMCATGIAIVDCTPQADNLMNLQNFVKNVEQYNKSWGSRKTHDGAAFIDKVILSKAIMEKKDVQVFMQTNPKASNRVFWDRHTLQAMKPGKTAAVDDDTQVLVTLQNWPPQNNEQVKDTLDHFVAIAIRRKIMVACILDENEQFSLEFEKTTQHMTWKLLTHNAKVANWICTNLMDMAIGLNDCSANVNFKSTHHLLAKEQVKKYLSTLMIKDIQSDAMDEGVGVQQAASAGTGAADAASSHASDWTCA
jgi:hypothetical protein